MKKDKNSCKSDVNKKNSEHDILNQKISTEENSIITDPNGSWTGVPLDKKEKPIQDVDDL